MDNINFDNNGGMLLFQQALKFMQSAYSDCIASLAAAIGVNVILSGCVRNGSTIGAGRMIVNGEVVPFAGGQYADYVTVQEADTNKQYNDGSVQQMYAQRSAACANVATGNVPFVNFVTIQQLAAFAKLPTTTGSQYATANDNVLATQTGLFNVYNALKGQVPSGAIMMWGGAITAIPVGWKLCDGNNATPNLRDRFIVGAGNTYGVGNVGGNNIIFLSQSQLPSHSHYVAADAGSSATFPDAATYVAKGSNNANGNQDYNLTKTATPATIGLSSFVGSGAGIDIRPMYYALAFIMKT